MEFRAFVCKNQLNAVSQYDYISYYPHLIQNKSDIEKRIVSFFETQLRETLKSHQSYVLDLYVGKNKLIVIELNSFEAWTGSSFSSFNNFFEFSCRWLPVYVA
jgi:hypothetical protein